MPQSRHFRQQNNKLATRVSSKKAPTFRSRFPSSCSLKHARNVICLMYYVLCIMSTFFTITQINQAEKVITRKHVFAEVVEMDQEIVGFILFFSHVSISGREVLRMGLLNREAHPKWGTSCRLKSVING